MEYFDALFGILFCGIGCRSSGFNLFISALVKVVLFMVISTEEYKLHSVEYRSGICFLSKEVGLKMDKKVTKEVTCV